MKAKLTTIGNSQGIILPKALLKQTSIEKEVILEIKDDKIVISALKEKSAREGWAKSFQSSEEKEGPLDFPNQFDQEEWEW